MTNVRTMPPLTPPGKVNVVVVSNQSTGSFSSTASLGDGLKKHEFSQDASRDGWNGRRVSCATATTEESVDHETKEDKSELRKSRSFNEEPVVTLPASRKPRAQSLSEDPRIKFPPYNPFSQHNYSPYRSPTRISNASIWINSGHRRRLEANDLQHPPLENEEDASSQSSVDSLDSEQEFEQVGLKMRSEIRQMEMIELALEAEKAAEAGEEFFVGKPSTFGDDSSGVDNVLMQLKPPGLKLRRRRTESSLLRPSLMARTRSLRPVSKLKVVALRDVNEVIPELGDLHKHLRSHFHQRGVDEQTLMYNQQGNLPPTNASDTPSVTSSVGQSIIFLRKLKLWGSHRSPSRDNSQKNLLAPTENVWGSRISPSGDSRKKTSFLTPRRSIHLQDPEFSPNSLIDLGENGNEEATPRTGRVAPGSRWDGNGSVGSLDSGEVGRVLSRQVVAGPPQHRGPIRVPSGLALPNIEKQEADDDDTPGSQESTKLPPPNRDTSESITISTDLSTSSSFEACENTNHTPPVTPFAVMEEDVDGADENSPVVLGDRRSNMQQLMGESGTFVTPIRLRDIKDKHRRCSSDGQMLGACFGPDESSGNSCSEGGTTFASNSVDKSVGDKDSTMFEQISALTIGPSQDFALPMRPLKNGLSELVEASEVTNDESEVEIPNGVSSTSLGVNLGAAETSSFQVDGSTGSSGKDASSWTALNTEATKGEAKLPGQERMEGEQMEPVGGCSFESKESRDEDSLQELRGSFGKIPHGERISEKGEPNEQKNQFPQTPTYGSCECLISSVSTTESNTSIDVGADEAPNTKNEKERKGKLRRVMSLPSLTEVAGRPKKNAKTDPTHLFAKGMSEAGASNFASRFDVTSLKRRFASGQSEPGGSSLATRFDLAAKRMLKRLSSRSDNKNMTMPLGSNGLFVPVKDNDAFLNNYLYCSKPPDSKSNVPEAPEKLCEPSLAPCSDLVGCGGFAGAFDAAMEILPSRASEKETFSLNNGSTHDNEETERWFDSAVESAFEMLGGGSHEHGSRWTLSDFRAPSLMVKKTDSCRPHSGSPSKEKQVLIDDKLQEIFGMTREEFDSLATIERVKVKEEWSHMTSRGQTPPKSTRGPENNHYRPGKSRQDRDLSASDVLGMTLLTNSYSG